MFLAVTNALSGLVGVGGLFVMGGGLLPHTFPQFLGAASVFLANLSKLAGARGDIGLTGIRHIRWISPHETNARPFPKGDRPSGVRLAVCYSRCCLRRWLCLGRQHGSRRAGSCWILRQYHAQYRSIDWTRISGKYELARLGKR